MLTEKSVVGNQKDALRGEGLRALLDLRWKVFHLDPEIAELALEGASSRYWLAGRDGDPGKAVRTWAVKTALENCSGSCDLYRALSGLEDLVEKLTNAESTENPIQDKSTSEFEESLTRDNIASEVDDMAFNGA